MDAATDAATAGPEVERDDGAEGSAPHVALSPAAEAQVRAFLAAEGVDPAVGVLRIGVMPGGCSGFRYQLLIEDGPADDDLVDERDGYRVAIDPFSAQYLDGVDVDYVSSLQGSGFTFRNPNSTGGCGCGSSFST